MIYYKYMFDLYALYSYILVTICWAKRGWDWENSLRGLAVQNGSICIMSHRTGWTSTEKLVCEDQRKIMPVYNTAVLSYPWGDILGALGMLELWLIPALNMLCLYVCVYIYIYASYMS